MPALRFVAEQRIHRLSAAPARALVAWGDGFPVELLTTVPSPKHVLELQAQGGRCVSLLPDGTPTQPHADTFAFALHDLCHLDKFIDPHHHAGQVGFFGRLDATTNRAEWSRFEESFDEIFRQDWHHVAADMNGSAVFLFAALKMKLKMAVRRRVAADNGVRPDDSGPLDPHESRAYEAALDELLWLLGLESNVADAARRTSTRRDDPRSACLLLSYFEALGHERKTARMTPSARAIEPTCL